MDSMNNFGSRQQLLSEPAAGHHIAQLYGDDRQLIETVGFFVREGLRRNEAVILLATPEHWAGVVTYLERDADVDLFSAVLCGQLRILDAQISLASCMKEGEPDWDNFCNLVSTELNRTAKKFPVLRIHGEMVDLLWRQGRYAAARRIEGFWNAIAQQHRFSLLCTYGIDKQDAHSVDATLKYVCATHSHLVQNTGRNSGEADSVLHSDAIK
jgi:hypothetical protein